MAGIPSKINPDSLNHHCELEDTHKGKHECACGIKWYGKMRFRI